jgi:enamine deaminase RidA (YjgF/YER057c/UK114 family)
VTERRRISSGGRWEASAGYSRAVVVGDTCHVSGTTDAGSDGRSRHPGDAVAQARAAWTIVRAALEDGGFAIDDVVRTRMYVTTREDVDPVIAVHGEVFGSVRPAATIVVVSALIDPTLLVEVEADARR